ncbi:hypothetical protein ASZ78_011566 [Callipepla squamata]|uniref:Aminotransferase class I/classII large domain-containing protein n=1 Tax=Callipepla squamata TaxID=9009 RepID=A0A226MFD1_CALSU|nr:hypothetical protein ASZ78_011566 [Callipepla squamata]
MLSARGARIAVGVPGPQDRGFALYAADPFDRERNPEVREAAPGAAGSRRGSAAQCPLFQGIVNLGTSENRLCFDLIEERLTRPDMNCLEPDLFQYPDTQGARSFREEIAKFLTDYTRAPEELRPEHVSNEESHPFQLTVEKLEAAIQRAKEQGIRVRILVLINPNNPVGDIYPAQLLKECLEFAHRHELHVIMDEIYMLSVYDDITFTSVLSLDSLPDPERTHFMWGFSKDFGMSGIRVGVLHTQNHEIQKAVNQLAVFHGCPGPVQHVLSQLLKDRDWLDNVFFPTNKKRLKEAQNLLVDGLADIGIPVLKSSGGLFVWADFRKFLKSPTFEAELELWQKLLDKKLLISPGKAFYCYEPGWFRLVFSDSVDKIYLCIERLQQMLHTDDAKPVVNNTSSTADSSCSPEEDSSGTPSNTPQDDASQLKNILVF